MTHPFAFETELRKIIINIIEDTVSPTKTPRFEYNSLASSLQYTLREIRKERNLYTTPYNFDALAGSTICVETDSEDESYREYINDVNKVIAIAINGCVLIYNALIAAHGEIIIHNKNFISSILVDMYLDDIANAETIRDLPFNIWFEGDDVQEYKEQVDKAMMKFVSNK